MYGGRKTIRTGVSVDCEGISIQTSCYSPHMHDTQTVPSTIRNAHILIFDLRAYGEKGNDFMIVKRTLEFVGFTPLILNCRQLQHRVLRKIRNVTETFSALQDKFRPNNSSEMKVRLRSGLLISLSSFHTFSHQIHAHISGCTLLVE